MDATPSLSLFLPSMHRSRNTNEVSANVRQVFSEVEYVGKYVAETKATCQWVLAFEGAKKEKVSFIVYDSSVSGKKEIFRDGVHIYSHIVTNHPRETIYSEHMPLSSLPENNVYALTLDYYTYYLQHVIHIQVLQSLQRSRITCRKKGIMSSVLPRVFRLFVDGVNFEILPVYFRQDKLFSCSSLAAFSPDAAITRSSCNPPSMCSSFSASFSMESIRNRSSASYDAISRSRSRELGRMELPIKRQHPYQRILSSDHEYNRPVWLVGSGY
ncbi:hypothetical protein BLSTO_05294 [Blastocystis sp. subtype 1]